MEDGDAKALQSYNIGMRRIAVLRPVGKFIPDEIKKGHYRELTLYCLLTAHHMLMRSRR